MDRHLGWFLFIAIVNVEVNAQPAIDKSSVPTSLNPGLREYHTIVGEKKARAG